MWSPLEQFEVIPLGLLTNATIMMMFGGAVVIVWIFLIKTSNTLVPNRWQSIMESMYRVIVGMVYESAGKGEYVYLVLTLFMLILVWNVLGLVPYSYTVTAQLICTITLSTGVWIGKLIVGLSKHGARLWGMMIPGGAPFAMVPFFVLLEIIGFVIPLISLAVRLFANMMSGHILLKVLFGFTWVMMMGSVGLWVVHWIPLGILVLLLGLELAVALIQAYVFALLTCIYIGDMENLH